MARLAAATCESCSKRIYLDRRDAKAAARRWHSGHHMSAYRCPALGDVWHIGHLAGKVIAGDVVRGDVYVK